MLRCMLGSVKGVKSENPKGEWEFRKWEGVNILLQRLPTYYKIFVKFSFKALIQFHIDATVIKPLKL